MGTITIKKEAGIAYLLWFFLGGLGVHKFYLNKIGIGLLYLFVSTTFWIGIIVSFILETPGLAVLYILTGSILGIGLIIDLFTLPSQVKKVNTLAEKE